MPKSYHLEFSAGEEKIVASRLELLTCGPYYTTPSMLG